MKRDVEGLIPSDFLGPRGAIAEEAGHRDFLDAVVALETWEKPSLPHSLRTIHQLKKPTSYRHWRQDPRPPPSKETRGTLDFQALSGQPQGLRLSASFSHGLPNGTIAKWDGTWELTGGPSVRLSSVSGHIRFSQRLLITQLPLQACGHGAHTNV